MITKKHVRIIDFVFAVGTLVFILAGIYFGFYYNSGIMLGPPEPFFVYEVLNVGAHRIPILHNDEGEDKVIPAGGATVQFESGDYYLDFKEGVVKLSFQEPVSLEFRKIDENHFGIFNSEGVINVQSAKYTNLGKFNTGEFNLGGVK